MIHRALLGSLERFFGILIEHHAGAFPLWLAPNQITFIPIADRHEEAANKMCSLLKKRGYRVNVDDSNDRMSNKIRKAQKLKTPLMLVIGDEEVEQGGAAVRLRSGENLGLMTTEQVLDYLDKTTAEEVPEPPDLPVVK